MIEQLIVLSATTASVLSLWFDTEAVLHYGAAMGLELPHTEMYTESLAGNSWSYPEFLGEMFGAFSFWCKLLSCPTCLSYWVAGGFGLLFSLWRWDGSWLLTALPSAFLGCILYKHLKDR